MLLKGNERKGYSIFDRWMYDGGILFNAVNMIVFLVVEIFGQFGPEMKPPRYHEAQVV
ncbi:hypothetical protein KFK09_022525 [Dendrobium nobile]|uniref:Uncharacterized protein n=1 Tax=Dendrobium nobile TaxID=94219 RepID=A0A8T3AI35_DENNO|nr:hypothetical protein KFK09_022525 [Dendrobium nobile]